MPKDVRKARTPHFQILLNGLCILLACGACTAEATTPTTTNAPTESTKTMNTIQDSEKAKLQTYVQDGDRNLDPSQADAWASKGTFQIGDFPEVTGPGEIRGFLDGFFKQKMFKKLEHEIGRVLELPGEVSFQANAIYTLQNDEKLVVPYANFITYTREDGKLKFQTYRVYINPEGLMKRAQELNRTGK
jgi:hypothetical protein